MRIHRLVHLCVWTAALVTVLTGCREDPPTGRFERNLGTADAPLLPTGQYTYDERIVDGRAKPVARGQRPQATPAASDAQPADEERAGDAVDTAELSEAEQAAIRTVVDEYNGALSQKQYDKLSDFHILEQRETARVIYAAGPKLELRLNDLADAVEPRQPGFKATIEAMKDGMAAGQLQVGEISADGPDAARATVPGAGRPLLFKRQDGAWLIELPLPNNERAGDVRDALDEVVKDFDQLIDDAESGAVSPAELPARLIAIGQKLAPLMAGGAAPPPSEPE